MSNTNGKRNSSTDINERRKRKRTISNDLLRGLDLSDRIRDTASDSTLDSSTLESEVDSDYLEETGSTGDKENKCRKCDDLSKLLEVHNEVLALLKEIKRDNERIHKTLSLQMQMCRQEIDQHVQDLKHSVNRITRLSMIDIHHTDDNGNAFLPSQWMDDEQSPSGGDEDDEVFHR